MSKLVLFACVLLGLTATFISALNLTPINLVRGRPNINIKKYNIQPHSLSVSGLSSGGFMAVQFQVAYSAAIVGAGIFAGK